MINLTNETNRALLHKIVFVLNSRVSIVAYFFLLLQQELMDRISEVSSPNILKSRRIRHVEPRFRKSGRTYHRKIQCTSNRISLGNELIIPPVGHRTIQDYYIEKLYRNHKLT